MEKIEIVQNGVQKKDSYEKNIKQQSKLFSNGIQYSYANYDSYTFK